jgi:wyosine [tRNA(Phe)-imidazoG37] synthetase (radical SAM superfamily)
MKYVFGPVPSRRLGFSLGIDLVPFKTCTLDCVYCQLGPTTNKTTERKEFVDKRGVVREVRQALTSDARIDYLTISGSGEPTLSASLGWVIAEIKKIAETPVAVLTNGTLFFREDVRRDLLAADLVIPSLDAGCEATFQAVNRPCETLQFSQLVDGLIQFRSEFKNSIFLEIMLVKGMNDSAEEIAKMKEIVDKVRPDKVQLNTVIRPPAEASAEPLSEQELARLASRFGSGCEVIARFDTRKHSAPMEEIEEQIKSMCRRRPVTVSDIASTLNLHRHEALKYVEDLLRRETLIVSVRDGKRYYAMRG